MRKTRKRFKLRASSTARGWISSLMSRTETTRGLHTGLLTLKGKKKGRTRRSSGASGRSRRSGPVGGRDARSEPEGVPAGFDSLEPPIWEDGVRERSELGMA